VNAILPASLQGGTAWSNTPRAQITDFDTTKRENFNLDYNHTFRGAATTRSRAATASSTS
jgi:hypothetical protein